MDLPPILNIKLLIFYLCIHSVESYHSINPIDLSCRKRLWF